MSVIFKFVIISLLVIFNYFNVTGLGKDYVVLYEGLKAPVSISYKHNKQPECTVVNFVMFTYCDFNYDSVDTPGNTHSLMPFMFGGVRAHEVYYVESARSGIVSTNYQLDHMINRTISALIILILSLLMTVAAFTHNSESRVEPSSVNGRRSR